MRLGMVIDYSGGFAETIELLQEYHQLACRYGYETEACEIQDRFLSGQKVEAAAAVAQWLVEIVSLMSDEDFIRLRVEAFEVAGARTLVLNPLVTAAEERVEHAGRLSAVVGGRR